MVKLRDTYESNKERESVIGGTADAAPRDNLDGRVDDSVKEVLTLISRKETVLQQQ